MSDLHEPFHEVRDPLYGFVKLSKAEWKIVNCPEFQRLRDIRQLAMGHMVYPGANHTRFEHSIGCLHLSSQMFDELVRSEENRRVLHAFFKLNQEGLKRARLLLRLAALLHDIGHPPFSHSGESLLPVDPDSRGKRRKHEFFSASIIRNGGIAQVIKDEYGPSQNIDLDEVVAVATEKIYAPGFGGYAHHDFLNELLAGELGSDRVDYLLRDAYHSGQRSGEFDYRRLIGSLTLVPPPKEAEGTYRIGFDEGGWLVAEQMIVSRYLMYQSIYFHKTKRIYEMHLEEFIRDWLESERGAKTFPLELPDYLALSDSVIVGAIREAGADPKHPLHTKSKPFCERTHMRLAREIILADNALIDQGGGARRKHCQARFDKLKEFVRNTFGNDLIRCDAPDHSATKMFDPAGKILVLLDDEPRYLDDISEIVRGMSSKIWRGRVYAATESRDTVREACETWLAENPVDKFVKNEGKA